MTDQAHEKPTLKSLVRRPELWMTLLLTAFFGLNILIGAPAFVNRQTYGLIYLIAFIGGLGLLFAFAKWSTSRLVALSAALLLGGWGIHRFYLGFTRTAWTMTALLLGSIVVAVVVAYLDAKPNPMPPLELVKAATYEFFTALSVVAPFPVAGFTLLSAELTSPWLVTHYGPRALTVPLFLAFYAMVSTLLVWNACDIVWIGVKLAIEATTRWRRLQRAARPSA